MRDALLTRCRAATHDDNEFEEFYHEIDRYGSPRRASTASSASPATQNRRPRGASGGYSIPGNQQWFLVYWHLFSLLGCCAAVGLAAKSTATFEDGALLDFGPQNTSVGASVAGSSSSSSVRVNPLMRHARQSQKQGSTNVCFVWSHSAIDDLCERSRWQRLLLMREISLFQADCDHAAANVQLVELFRINFTEVTSETDLLSGTEHLQLGVRGRDCVMARPGSRECSRCFHRLNDNLLQLDVAYKAFNKTLHRFDCMLAVDSSSATRPFSPNGSCTDCKLWYRKWLLVQLVDMWKEPPCINWCYYAQLACPHLATSKVVDYAGHPSFQCRDLHIPLSGSSSTERSTSSCHCVHPCDLHPERDPLPRSTRASSSSAPAAADGSAVDLFDFFAAREHCSTRKAQCDKEDAAAAARNRAAFPSSPATAAPPASNIAEDENGNFNEVNVALPTPQARSQRFDDNRVYRHRPPRHRNAGIRAELTVSSSTSAAAASLSLLIRLLTMSLGPF